VTAPLPLKPCANELCHALVSPASLYCCDPCYRSGEGGYEIHEDGPLGHSSSCMDRQRGRGIDPRTGPIR
jgi:hypothetical protein